MGNEECLIRSRHGRVLAARRLTATCRVRAMVSLHLVFECPLLEARNRQSVRVESTRPSKWQTISAIYLLDRTSSGRLVDD